MDCQAENRPFKAVFLIASLRFFTHNCVHIVPIVRRYNFSRIAIVSRINTTSIHRISSASDIVEQTAPIVARRVPEERIQQVFPLDPVARAARAVLDDPEEPRVPRRISLNVLVDETTFRIRRAEPSSVAERRRPAEFDGIDREGVNPELAAVFRNFREVPGEPRFNAVFALDARLSPLSFNQRPLTLPPIYDQVARAARPCCRAWPMLFRKPPNKPIRHGKQVGRPNQPRRNHHRPQADCHVRERTPSSPVDTRVTLHVEAKTSPVIRAILTLAAYLYFYGVSVGIGNVQLAFVHAVIVFATFIFGYFGRK